MAQRYQQARARGQAAVSSLPSLTVLHRYRFARGWGLQGVRATARQLHRYRRQKAPRGTLTFNSHPPVAHTEGGDQALSTELSTRGFSDSPSLAGGIGGAASLSPTSGEEIPELSHLGPDLLVLQIREMLGKPPRVRADLEALSGHLPRDSPSFPLRHVGDLPTLTV